MEQLPHNLSPADRAIRILLGVGLLTLSLGRWVDGHWALACFLFAWVPLVTGIGGWCPIYQLFGISTCRRG